MLIATTGVVSTLEQIHSINMRAVFGGTFFILCCLVAASLFKNNRRASSYVFWVLIGAIGLVSGILLASAVYVMQNHVLLDIWSITL